METQRRIKQCNKCGDLPKLIENSMQSGKTSFVIIGESPAKEKCISETLVKYTLE